MKMLTFSTLIVITFLFGCGLGDTDQVTEFEDEGRLCLRNPDSASFEPDPGVESGDVRVEVIFDSCASSTCTTLEEARCETTVDGDEIRVTSYGRIRSEGGANVACSDDCGILSAFCDVGTLEEGSYTIVHSDATGTIEVPGDDPCLDQPR